MSVPLLRMSAALHVAGLLALAAAPRAWPWVAGAFVLDHATLFGTGLWPRSRWLGPNMTRLPAEAAARGEIALTFDDGPDPETTPRVLDVLASHGVRASFFAIGRRALAHPDVVAETARRGHHVENHSFSHSNAFSIFLPAAAGRELDRAQDAIAAGAAGAPSLFRAPAGLRPPWIESQLRRRGLRLVSWTRRGFDTVDGDPVRVAARLTRNLAAGDILLLHDAGSARAVSGRPVVLEALPRVLDAIAKAGLRPVPIPSLR